MHVVHRLSDGVITTSRYLTDLYTRQGLLTVELPTLFDAGRFTAPSSRGTKNLKKFIYVGSPFDASKVNRRRTNLKERLDTCVDVFYALHEAGKDFTFDVFGISLEDYLKVFPEHRNKTVHMAGKITFHGRKPNVIVLEQIRNSDFSIFFRDRTRVTLAGFPSKLAESITAGTPVISNTMLSLQCYAHTPGVYLSDRGEELTAVANLIDTPGAAIDSMKSQAFESRTFHYENYKNIVSNFLLRVGI
jgi:glycosyltransferase involved in cell wall biosynthesis